MPAPLQFTETSSRFNLPFLFAGQSQKEFFVNEAMALTDILLHTAVNAIAATPPADPADGDVWIVGDAPVGEWTAHQGQIAARQAGAWIFVTPCEGMRVFNKEWDQIICYRNGWHRPEKPAPIAGGQTIDSELRIAFTNLIASLGAAGIFPVSE